MRRRGEGAAFDDDDADLNGRWRSVERGLQGFRQGARRDDGRAGIAPTRTLVAFKFDSDLELTRPVRITVMDVESSINVDQIQQ